MLLFINYKIGPQKQIGGPVVHGDPSIHQPVGLQDAMAAAIMMVGVVGGGQSQRRLQHLWRIRILPPATFFTYKAVVCTRYDNLKLLEAGSQHSHMPLIGTQLALISLMVENWKCIPRG